MAAQQIRARPSAGLNAQRISAWSILNIISARFIIRAATAQRRQFRMPAKPTIGIRLPRKNGDQQAGPLAAGVAVALTPAQRQDADAAIASWVPQTPDPAANELAVSN